MRTANCLALILGALSMSSAFAQSPKQDAKVTVVLVPGAGGATPSDFLIRNEKAFVSQGLQTKVVTTAAEAVAAANAIRESGGKAVLVGMSAGTPKVAQVIAQGASVAGAVFCCGDAGARRGRNAL
jgi:predicted alpha/beta-hydrolase family hydrolase